MKTSRLWTTLGELAVLICCNMAFIGLKRPVHPNTIWADPSFTGWCASIANGIGNGSRLYSDGMHTPLPPLSYILLKPFGHATWAVENDVMLALSAFTSLSCYRLLRMFGGGPVPLLASVAIVPGLYGNWLLYNVFAHAWSPLIAIALVRHCRAQSGAFRWEVALWVLVALQMLTKHTHGVAGASVAALIVGSNNTPHGGILSVALSAARFAAGAFGVFVAIAFAMSAWIDPVGMFFDVFIKGSEPKGGPGTLLAHLCGSGITLVAAMLLLQLIAMLFGSVRMSPVPARDSATVPAECTVVTPASVCVSMYASLLLAAAILAALYPFKWSWGRVIGALTLVADPMFAMLIAWCTLVAIQAIRRPVATDADAVHSRSLAAVRLLAVSTAVLAGVSSAAPVWGDFGGYLVMGVAMHGAFEAIRQAATMQVGLSVTAMTNTKVVLASTMVLATSAAVAVPIIGFYRTCTVVWPDVPHLCGARLPASAVLFRRVLDVVGELAGDERRDKVLMLPEDPGVFAWFGRARPNLTCANLFVDTYWDRFVDEDIRRIGADIPKVIVLGPLIRAGEMYSDWHPGWGVERLEQRVRSEIIPRRYQLIERVRITVRGKPDIIEVYVRVDSGK